MADLDTLLYPPIEPIETGRIAVDELHTLCWERCGNPDGLPAVFLHGGPGAGISPKSRRFFDPAKYHIILLDQRGSGQSTPLGETRHNTTQHLVADLERLRVQLGIERWLVFGGSWGSTLALAYAQAHAERCLGLVLRGIWLGTREEIQWWLHGVRQFFPREWEAFAGHVPEADGGDLLAAYQQRLGASDPATRQAAARAWSVYEGSCLQLRPEAAMVRDFADDAFALAIARLEAHYFAHEAFLTPGQLLANVARIAHLPAFIVHGRYDVICPVRYAFALADAWPSARLEVVPDAGHTAFEPGIAAALVRATDRFAATGRFD